MHVKEKTKTRHNQHTAAVNALPSENRLGRLRSPHLVCFCAGTVFGFVVYTTVLASFYACFVQRHPAVEYLLPRHQTMNEAHSDHSSRMSVAVDSATSTTTASDSGRETVVGDDEAAATTTPTTAQGDRGISLLIDAAATSLGGKGRQCSGTAAADFPVTSDIKSPNSGSTVEILPPGQTQSSRVRSSLPANAAVPFFGRSDSESMREMSSHLDHLLEEYREDLVRVVQGVDLIIRGLEEQAAKNGGQRSSGDSDMPPEGMRRIADKLRRKLAKTPPRWQVNIDVLTWLLRPVPFVTGLPAPGLGSPAPFFSRSSASTSTTNEPQSQQQSPCDATSNEKNINQKSKLDDQVVHVQKEQQASCRGTAAAAAATPPFNLKRKTAETQDPGGGGRLGNRPAYGTQSTARGASAKASRVVDSAESEMSGLDLSGDVTAAQSAHGKRECGRDSTSGKMPRTQKPRQPGPSIVRTVDPDIVYDISNVESPSLPAVEERRGFPVRSAAPTFGPSLGGGGGTAAAAAAAAAAGGRERAFNRTGFHAYDETHQIFTHLLRDWTAEGESVRAAVYNPLLRALDLYVGWHQKPGTAPYTFSAAPGSTTESSAANAAGRRTESVGANGGSSGGGGGSSAWKHYREQRPRRAKKAKRTANVLVPGAGLGRLAVEVAARGYASVHANELSPTMLASCYWLMEALKGDDLPAGCGGGIEPTTFTSAPREGEGSLDGARVSTTAGSFSDSAQEQGKGKGRWSPPPAADRMIERDDEEVDGVQHGGEDGMEESEELEKTEKRLHTQGGGDDAAGGVGVGGSSPSGVDGSSSGAGETESENDVDVEERRNGMRGWAAPEEGGATRLEYCEFYPFLNDAPHNEMDGEARFRPVLFPDPAGRAVLARASGRLSFQAGEFSATYGVPGGPFEAAFDAIVTSFFVDTAPNVVEYVATIRRTLRPGGVWINCGPLHWHKQSALALSLDEMLALVAGSGFRLEVVERLPPCGYRVAESARSLRVDEFKPVFWVAVLEGNYVGS